MIIQKLLRRASTHSVFDRQQRPQKVTDPLYSPFDDGHRRLSEKAAVEGQLLNPPAEAQRRRERGDARRRKGQNAKRGEAADERRQLADVRLGHPQLLERGQRPHPTAAVEGGGKGGRERWRRRQRDGLDRVRVQLKDAEGGGVWQERRELRQLVVVYSKNGQRRRETRRKSDDAVVAEREFLQRDKRREVQINKRNLKKTKERRGEWKRKKPKLE